MANSDVNDPFTFEDDLETTMHEIGHILGFSGYAIYNWRNPENGEPYAQPTESSFFRGKTTTILKTPKVLEYAKEYYSKENIYF